MQNTFAYKISKSKWNRSSNRSSALWCTVQYSQVKSKIGLRLEADLNVSLQDVVGKGLWLSVRNDLRRQAYITMVTLWHSNFWDQIKNEGKMQYKIDNLYIDRENFYFMLSSKSNSILVDLLTWTVCMTCPYLRGPWMKFCKVK